MIPSEELSKIPQQLPDRSAEQNKQGMCREAQTGHRDGRRNKDKSIKETTHKKLIIKV